MNDSILNHKPVLLKEVIEYLKPEKNQIVIDATFGNGGHAGEILKNIQPNGELIAIDWDEELINKAKIKFLHNVKFRIGNYVEVLKKINKQKIKADGILFDLGMSSWHLGYSGRGFSFQKDEFLDMRYNKSNELTAWQIINTWKEKEIEEILKGYGEERKAGLIAKTICQKRKQMKIDTTRILREIVEKVYGKRHFKINPVTKTFQALRIMVNDELNNIRQGLSEGIKTLKKDGRMTVISFHSLEDKIVKEFFKEGKIKNILKILTKKPIRPLREEVLNNPRARSAKLRAVIKN